MFGQHKKCDKGAEGKILGPIDNHEEEGSYSGFWVEMDDYEGAQVCIAF